MTSNHANSFASNLWERVSCGESGAEVFRRTDGSAYAKSVPAAGVDELRAEHERTAWLAAQGFAGPQVLDWSENDQGAQLVTSAVAGVPATDLPVADALAAWPSIVGLVQDLHSLPVGSCPFGRRLDEMLDRASGVVADGAVVDDFLRPEQLGRPAGDLLAELEAERELRLLQEQSSLVVCHGDACLPNILVDPATNLATGMIDLGRLGVADRHADLSLLWANATDEVFTGELVATVAEVLKSAYSAAEIDQDRLRFYVQLDPLTWHG